MEEGDFMKDSVSNKRYVVKLSQNTNKHVKAWRVTDFIEKVNNSYYKQELLREIKERLKQGEDPANIIILDKSFNIHKNYQGIGMLKLNKTNGAKRLYHLGKPYSLYPNLRIILINNIFNTFSKLYTLFNKYGVRLDKSILNTVIKQAYESKEGLDLRELYSELKRGLESLDENEHLIKGLKLKVSEELEELKLKINADLQKAKTYLELENLIDDESSFKSKLNDNEYRKLYNLFPNRFAEYFVNTIRPIVGIYNADKNTIEILGVNFIKKDGYDDKQIDLKSVSHNSPFTVILIAGITLVASLYQMYCNRSDRNTIENEEEGIYSTLQEFNFDEDEDEDDVFERDISEGKILIERWQKAKEQLTTIIEEDKESIEEELNIAEGSEVIPATNVKYSINITINNMSNNVQNYFDKAFESNDFKGGEVEVALEEA